MYYKRGYKVRFIYFFRKFESFVKVRKFYKKKYKGFFITLRIC